MRAGEPAALVTLEPAVVDRHAGIWMAMYVATIDVQSRIQAMRRRFAVVTLDEVQNEHAVMRRFAWP